MNIHFLLAFVLIIAVVLYFFPELDAVIKKILYFIAIVCTLVWVLDLVFGLHAPYFR